VRLHINAVGMVRGGSARLLQASIPALMAVRPDWDVHLYMSRRGREFSMPNVRTETVNRSSWRRLGWDSITVGHRASAAGADVLLNMADYGPVRSRIPSVLYQANNLYFDRTWVDRLGSIARTETLFRRELAFVQMRNSVAVVVPSEAMYRMLRSWRGCPRDVPIEIIPHGVDLDRFQFLPPSKSNQVRIVTLGVEYPHKDFGLLVDMMEELRRRNIDANLDLTAYDDGSLRHVSALRERIRATGLQDRIRLVGRVDAPSFLADADVMVMPSVTESFGFPILEAMASGVPIVASSIPSTTELLGDLGWYFPVGDAVAAADGVVKMLEADPSDIGRRLTSARGIASRYTWKENANRVARLVESIVKIG
jgi:glycosyltransferase involved in cell wall biosynthesis